MCRDRINYQVFNQIKSNINIHIKEGVNSYTTASLIKCDFLSKEAGSISCGVPLKLSDFK